MCNRLFFSVVIILVAGSVYGQPKTNTNSDLDNPKEPDYSNLYYWAAHPWKRDPADSVPADLRNGYVVDSLVDVFFIHPTTYTDKDFNLGNASVDDEILNEKTDNSSILYQASVFNESNRVFAPRYRQAHISSFSLDSSKSKILFDLAYADVKKSFEYYLEHFNGSRPIIIASHSQGTLHAARILKEFFEGKILMNRLVCAYLIGLPVPENYFKILPPCSDSNSTGCFVSWRTFKNGYTPEYVQKEKFKSIVTNPISWKNDEVFVSDKYNRGGILKDFNTLVPNVVSAQVKNNILWSSKPNIFGKILFFKKNFHIGDINLFYLNIRENVKNRIHCFWKK